MNNIQTRPEDLPYAVSHGARGTGPESLAEDQSGYKPNDRCPRCQVGKLDYNGLLNLECSNCGYTLGGCFT